MILKVMKKMSALAMAFVLVLTSMPMQAFAAKNAFFQGEDISVTSQSEFTVEGESVKLSAKTTSSTCITGTTYTPTTVEANIKNNSGEDGLITFDFEASDNYQWITIDGVEYNATTGAKGSFSKALAAGSSITVKLRSAEKSDGTGYLTLKTFNLTDTSPKTVEVLTSEYGSITVDSVLLSQNTSYTVTYEESGIQLVATPNKGYVFCGWIDQDNNIISQAANYLFKPGTNGTVEALFAIENTGTAYFKVGKKLCMNLDEAIKYAEKNNGDTIISINSGVVEPIAGGYTIPKGITLLIPFDVGETKYNTTEPGSIPQAQYSTPTPYRTLTLKDNVKMKIEGNLNVGANHTAGQASGVSKVGAPTGKCGFLYLNGKETEVTIASGGNLYAWGFITGDGKVTAESGSTVYENIQITDYRGGTKSGLMAAGIAGTGRTFLFSQYYVQNIEVPITFKAGAVEEVATSVYLNDKDINHGGFRFIGSDSALFNLKSGELTKSYDGETDRLKIEIEGTAEVAPLSVYVGTDIDTKKFDVPITNNMSIGLHTDSTLTVSQNLALLPGSVVNVDKDATINITKGYNLYVYDADQWKNTYTILNTNTVPVVYAPSRKQGIDRTNVALEDATIDLNGTIKSSGGMYTTDGGSSIISSNGTGLFCLKEAAPEDSTTPQYSQNTDTLDKIPVTSAKLKNKGDTYTSTKGSTAGTIFVYGDGKWKSALDVKFKPNGATSGDEFSQTVPIKDITNIDNDETKSFKLSTVQPFSRTGYTFTGWNTKLDGHGTSYNSGATVEISNYNDITLYAQWAGEPFTANFVFVNGDKQETLDSIEKEYGSPLGDLTKLTTPTKKGYSFKEWNTKSDGSGDKVTAKTTMPLNGATYYAQMDPNPYEVKFNGNGATGGEMINQTFEYDAEAKALSENKYVKENTVTYNYNGSGADANVKPVGWTFNGWNTKENGSGEKTYADKEAVRNLAESGVFTLYAQWTPEKETVAAAPQRNGYEFTGWNTKADGSGDSYRAGDEVTVDKNITFYAQWSANPYEVKFNGNGSTYGSMENQAFMYDEAQKLTANGFKREYTVTYNHNYAGAEKGTAKATAEFNGWATAAGGEVVYADKQEVKNLAESGVYQLYANWTPETIKLATPTRAGYTFAGWATAADGDKAYDGGEEYTPATDMELFAQWTKNPYEVKFNGNGSTYGSMENQAFTYDEAQKLTANGFKREYTVTYNQNYAGTEKGTAKATAKFNGWATAADGEVVYADKQEVKNLTESGVYQLYANWAPETIKLATPTRAGYTFAGWATAADGDKAYDGGEEYTPATDIELFAKWTLNQYTITFDTVGGSEVEPIIQDYNSKVTVPADPTREGYTFAGWDVEIPETMPAKNVTVTAKWTINQYTIRFDTAGGSEVEPITQDYGSDVKAPADPTKEGYTFAGWDVKIPEKMPAKNVTVTAKWTINQYTISFDTAGGSEVEPITQDYGSDVKAPADPTREGYTFAGWDVKIPEKMPAENQTINAKWTVNTYTITFDTDGAGTIASITEEYGTKIDKPADPEKDGYVFSGWMLDGTVIDYPTHMPAGKVPGGNIALVAKWTANEPSWAEFHDHNGLIVKDTGLVGQIVKVPADPTRDGYTFEGWDPSWDTKELRFVGGGATYTAVWEPIVYKLEYDLDNGTLAEENPAKYTIESDDITLNNPTRKGYTFLGWTGTELDGKQKEVTIAKGSIGDRSYTANWEINVYNLTYDLAGGELGKLEKNPEDYTVNDTFTLFNPTRDGYIFDGWLEGESTEAKTEVIFNDTTGHKTFTAKWTPIVYPIVYSLDGGKLEDGKTNPDEYTIESEDITLNNPTREGYNFLGWTGSNGTDPSTSVTIEQGTYGNQTYIANWEAIEYTASFDANCDELENPASITRDCDQALGDLPVLERVGYTFDGWYDVEGDKISSKTTMPADNVTYTAKWTANTYKITYDANGGEGAPREQKWTYAQEESIFLSDNRPTKSGYYFIGWSEDKAATDADYGSDAEIESTTWAEDVTLYAVWGITTYGITYVDTLTNTEIIGENPESYTVETPDFTLENPTKEGYDFVGWLEKGETEPKKTVTITQGTTGAKLFRLIWTPIDYTISYELDGGVLAEGSPENYNIESEDITLLAPSKTGYTFLGWTGPDVNEPKKDVTIKTGTIGDLTYTAHWTANPYEVEFEANGATSGKMDNQKFTYDVAQKLTENAFVREYVVTFDYNGSGAEKTTATATAAFEGWEDGDKTYEDKQKVSNLATEGTHKLFAKWTLGSVTLPAPERDGYVFAGWTTDKEGLETVEGTTYVPTEDTTLYAQWIANDYSVIFDGNKATSGEMSKQPFTYDVEQALTKNAFDRTYTVYFEGHIGSLEKDSATVSATFNGWALNDKGSKVYDDEAVVKNLTDVKDGEVTLYADWTLNAITLPAPERAGYTFAGWSTSEDGSMGEIFQAGDEFTPKASQTLFAKWKANPYEVEFVGNGATGGEPMDNQAFTYDKAQNLNENTYVREYVVTFDFNGNGDAAATATAKADFAGWEDGDKVYEDKQEVKNLATEGVHKLFAKWTLGSVELPTPERTGYTFTGWTTDKEGTVAVEGTTYVPTEDTTLYAQWMINKYTAEFDANGGNDADPQSIEKDYDTALGKLPETSRTGYTFNGWFTEAEGGEQITADTKMPVGGATYYAQWTINKHSITFDATNDSEPVKITKDYGSEVAVVEAPEREGYSFVSWNTKADGTGTEYAPGDKITLTDDVKLYAVWDVNQYTITFKTEGGSDVDPITQDYGTEVQKPADPAKKGYTFAGWDGDIPETMPAEDLTITAKWNINQYTATFDDTEGSGHKETITQDYDTDVTAPEGPDREGYTFLSWNTKADGTGKDYKPGKTIRLEDENITLYAQWQINQYKITFDANGGSDVDPIELDYNAEVKAPKDPSRYGYVFAGWEPALPEKMPAKDLEVKAQWVELEKYTATFEDHNGNTIGADSGYAGETIKVPADPTREGYTFAGWKPNVPEKFPEANTTYVAQWTANEYKAEFDANGGTKADPESMLKDCDEAFGELPVTTREGYTFQGWFTEKTGGTKITEETTMPAGDVTYYAQWAINTYTIEFDTDGGSAVDKIVQKFGTTIRKPATPSKTGHTFNGWNPAVPETMPAANLKLVAQWLVNQYTIVFNTDGGSKVEPITQGYGTAVTAPENPTKTGYTFAGWNAEIPATMPAGNKLIKAMWQINQYTITFDTAGGSEVAPITQDYGTAVTAPADPVRADYAFTGWDVEVPTTMPADDMKITAQWDYIYTGWKTTGEGTTYFENGKQPYKDEFATIDDVTYYFDEDSYIVKGVTDLEEGIYIFDKETGALIEGDGLYDFDGDLYLLDENRVVENAGLVKIDEDYYFFGEDNKAVKDQIVDVTDAKGYLPEGAYEFGSDGKMINVPVKLTEEIVKLKKDSVEYNGKQQTPTVVVKGFGADAYKVSYKNNIHVGKATVTVTGVEGCFGTVTMHFEITKAKNSWTEKLTMDGWAEGDVPMRPSAEAAFGEVEFGYFADKNCTDEIAVPDTAGTYYVKAFVEGTDDYSGLESKAVKFVIAGDAEDGEGPATGDQNQLALWFSLAMASMAGAFTAYRRRRDEM